ncbi:MAG: hypothetical protein CMJ46_03515 [Planctomyces sp.]|nr:hypothetical protein [Planctomyces sp.]
MSSLKRRRTWTFALSLGTASMMTVTAWAVPPASRPAASKNTSELQQTETQSGYARRQQQKVTARPQMPQLQQLNHAPQLLPVPQPRTAMGTAPRPSNSPFGVMKDQLQTVAGGSRPTGRTSEINAELRKLYEADGREMPNLPRHNPQPIPQPIPQPTAQPQNTPQPQNTAQTGAAPVQQQQQQFESDDNTTYYRPSFLSAGKGGSVSSTGPRPRGSANPNPIKRFFGKLGIGNNESEQEEIPQQAEQQQPQLTPQQQQMLLQQMRQQQLLQAQQQNAQPRTQQPQQAQTQQPPAQQPRTQQPRSQQPQIQQAQTQQPRTNANPAAGMTQEPTATFKIDLSPVANATKGSNVNPTRKETNNVTAFGDELANPFGGFEEEAASQPEPFGTVVEKTVVEKATPQPEVDEVPEEIIVQEAGRIELDLQNAFSDFGGAAEEESFDLADEMMTEETPVVSNSSENVLRKDTTEAPAEVPYIANDEEPFRLDLKADNGPAAAPIQEPAEIEKKTAAVESPFLMDLNVAETVPTPADAQGEPGLFQMAPTEGVPLEQPSNEDALAGDYETDIQDVTQPATTAAIVDVDAARETPGLGRFCPITLRNQLKLVEGLPQFRAVYDAKVYWFTSAYAKQMFQQNPELYTPVDGGYDIVLRESFDYQTEGSAVYSLWYRGRLYLFASSKTKETFRRNPEEFLK